MLLTHEQFVEGKANGPPEYIIAEDQIIDLLLKLTPAQEALVWGGEGCLWAELVTEVMLDGRLSPGATVVAECFWSPAFVRDAEGMS